MFCNFLLNFRANLNLDVNIFDKTYGALRFVVPGKSIHTVLYK